MGQASLILLIGFVSLAYVQGCTFKENARELIAVDYFTDALGNTAVDRIEVKMKDRRKFVNLMKEGCTNPRNKEINVQYRAKGAEEWEKGSKKKLSSWRPINWNNLNPCETYEVKVAYVDEPLEVFVVGPFYNEDHSHVYLDNEENEHYERYSQNPANHITITSEESSAKILVDGFCARTVVLEVQAEGEGEKPKPLILQNDLKNPQKLETTLPDLKPCTKYKIILDLYLNEKATLEAADESDEVDYIDMNFASFYTMPKMEVLKDLTSFDSETKTLSWDFNKFFKQDCADSEPTGIMNTTVTLTEGKEMEEMDLAGSKKMTGDCGRDVSLQVAYDKEENKWRRNLTVFNEFVPGDREASEESVKVENEHLVLTLEPCLKDLDMVEFAPLKATDYASAIQLTPEELRSSKLVSEVDWMGCLDYEVRFQRKGQEVKKLNQLKHPGWKNALDGFTLHVLTTANDSIKMQKPEIFWEDRAIKMKVVCNSSLTEGEFNTVEFDFEVDESLEVTGLNSSTEYECAAQLFKADGNSSGWSDEWSVSTLETGEPPQTSAPEVVTRRSPKEASEPTKSTLSGSGNLNFLSLTALVSTILLLTCSI